MTEAQTFWLAFLGAGGGLAFIKLLDWIITAFKERAASLREDKKTDAGLKQDEFERLQKLIDELDEARKRDREYFEQRICELQDQLAARDKERIVDRLAIADLEAEVAELREYMEKNGLKPPPRRERTRPRPPSKE